MLTESTVLAVPVHVMEGLVSPNESGVAVEQLRGARGHRSLKLGWRRMCIYIIIFIIIYIYIIMYIYTYIYTHI